MSVYGMLSRNGPGPSRRLPIQFVPPFPSSLFIPIPFPMGIECLLISPTTFHSTTIPSVATMLCLISVLLRSYGFQVFRLSDDSNHMSRYLVYKASLLYYLPQKFEHF